MSMFQFIPAQQPQHHVMELPPVRIRAAIHFVEMMQVQQKGYYRQGQNDFSTPTEPPPMGKTEKQTYDRALQLLERYFAREIYLPTDPDEMAEWIDQPEQWPLSIPEQEPPAPQTPAANPAEPHSAAPAAPPINEQQEPNP